ncbi:MAG: hypothetical protein KF893_16170 [Caldilineaceae bacterium]|nr:hypothetical protein [Caldilineaceae bacterium]
MIFRCPGNLIEVDYDGFLSQHDLVYLAPPVYGIDGLPIGNGDLGAMIWTPPERIHLAINKVDLWDDGPDAPFTAWGKPDEEVSTMLRSAGSLTIGHGLPSLDRLYLSDFEARLHLAEARVTIHARSPFGGLDAEIFASESAGVLVVHYRDWTEDKLPRRMELARWGSRSFLHWYRRIRREVPISLTGTQAGHEGNHLWITQQLRALDFALVARLDGPATPCRLHRRAGLFESEATDEFTGTLYVAVVHSEQEQDPLVAARQRVDVAATAGIEALRREHRHTWRRFWQTSFVDLPPEQDYVENLWYLNSYHVASASKGRYPFHFIDGIWSWNRDVRAWTHYYHWNEQIHTWPLHTAGQGDLAMPYYHWRREMLPHAIDDARRIHNADGAFFSDVANRKGYQAAEVGEGLGLNLTPGPQIALDFWRHYAYTRDRTFLRDMAYPLLREVTRFYLSMVNRQEDGSYTFVGTQPYEGNLFVRDTLTDLAHARTLFQVFLEAAGALDNDHELQDQCQRVLSSLVAYPQITVSTDYEVDPAATMGSRPLRFKELAQEDETMNIWSVGYKVAGLRSSGVDIPDGVPIHEGMTDPANNIWIFPSANLAPIFPSGCVGLDQVGTADYDIAVNTLNALGQDDAGFSLSMVSRARLGLADELAKSLEQWPSRFQIFPQGFARWEPEGHPDMDEDPRLLKEIEVQDSEGEKIYWPTAGVSIYCSFEAMPMLQLAINEMLLQSYSGTIRLFPAVPSTWSGRFRLHAIGGFIISASRTAPDTDYVVVESLLGESCRLVNPWPGRSVIRYQQIDGWQPVDRFDDELLSFATDVQTVYLLLPENVTPESLSTFHSTGNQNQGAKFLGKARLGMPKGI